MIRAKNYKTVTKFVKVMPRILWPLFFLGHGVLCHINTNNRYNVSRLKNKMYWKSSQLFDQNRFQEQRMS